MMRKALIYTVCLTSMLSAAALAAGPEGRWITENARSHIVIARCGANYCGKIAALKAPFNQDGNPKTDINNPDPALRRQLLIGLEIIRDMRPEDEGNTWRGQIYNPENGKIYDATMQLRPDGLKVEGCFAYVLCGSQVWRRAVED